MNNLMRAYLDSFELITIIMHKSIANYKKVFYFEENVSKIKLYVYDCLDDGDNLKYLIKHNNQIQLNKDYRISDNDGNSCLVSIGSITREPLFDELYSYDGELGVTYTKEKSIFRLWTPVAKTVKLVLNNTITKEMIYKDRGLWELEVEGDLELYTYYYLVRVFDKEVITKDPYAISSNVNFKDNYIIDLNKLYKKKYNPNYKDNHTKAVIYEASIRDLTSSLKSSNKGTYLGVVENNPTESGLPTGLDYIKYLGITHLQLLPFYNFGGIDEINKDDHYNWGYNPVEFLVPSGWYSLHPYSPYSRINELKELIDEANKRNLKVVMDVVFNHVYNSQTFPFDSLVPGYFYRHKNGWGTNASGCGNDLASEKLMCRKYIIDCLKYYVKIFGVSGFRFDLMGILDVKTISLAKKELLKLNSHLMLYGEGWDMQTGLHLNHKACMSNHRQMPGIGFFNDTYRDLIRGSQWTKSKGFAFGGGIDYQTLYYLLTGSSVDNYLVSKPSEIINYVECHDNYTFYDFGKVLLKLNNKKLKDYSLLAIQIILISNGTPFIHAGQEFGRTKMGVENAYMSGDKINCLDYTRRDKFKRNVLAVKDLIELRKNYPLFSSNNSGEIGKRVELDDYLTDPNHVVLRHKYDDFELVMVIKNNYDEVDFEMDNCIMIYNSRRLTKSTKNKYSLNNVGVYIFKRIVR